MNYDDIMELEHFHMPGRPYMSRTARAAQFAPYKSLTGYNEMIDTETEAVLTSGDEVVDYSERDEEWGEEIVLG